ncbi:MAG: phosphatase PAP2 family protein [Bacteroidales bacterium]|nr:phosphatase PAP2 family protein [Bacteroidales bacterium]
MRTRIFTATLFFLAVFSFRAHAQEIPTYFSARQMPDLIKALPAPPAFGTEAFTADSLRYLWGKEQRGDARRAAIAEEDAAWDYDALFFTFSDPFGFLISRQTTPAIYQVLQRGIETICQTRVEPKAFYHRQRPFVHYGEPMLTRWEEKDLAGEGSYPSGHTLRAWSAALLLSEINPAAADTLIGRARMVGESRVIAGAHWQSDVDASAQAAAIGYARLQTSEAYRQQMELAQEEYRRLTHQAAKPAPAPKLPYRNEIALAYSPVSSADLFFFYTGKLGSLIYPDYEQHVTGAFSAEYFRRLGRLVSVGGAFIFYNVSTKENGRKTGNSNFTLIPSVKLHWYDRRWFHAYSKFGAGVIFYDWKPKRENFAFTAQASLLGIEAGTRWRPFLELGVGEQGVALGGLRYCF